MELDFDTEFGSCDRIECDLIVLVAFDAGFVFEGDFLPLVIGIGEELPGLGKDFVMRVSEGGCRLGFVEPIGAEIFKGLRFGVFELYPFGGAALGMEAETW